MKLRLSCPRSWSWTFLCAAIVLAGVFPVLGRGSRAGAAIYVGLGVAETVAVVSGIRRYRPERARTWNLLAIGVGLYATANAVQFGWPVLLRGDLDFPSVADALFVVAYLFFIASMVALVRAR